MAIGARYVEARIEVKTNRSMHHAAGNRIDQFDNGRVIPADVPAGGLTIELRLLGRPPPDEWVKPPSRWTYDSGEAVHGSYLQIAQTPRVIPKLNNRDVAAGNCNW